ncbi:MAG: dephospho-CoA kinase [Actinomycetota bacterium]|mgnify:CR=1 FL=1
MPGQFYIGGGIGSGKSTAVSHFASLGAVVVSGDDAGRRVLAPGTAETALVHDRWPEAVGSGGVLDRKALGRIVFADPAQLLELEVITAPGIRRIVLEAVDASAGETVLVEVPVLHDLAGREWPWIVVDAPEATRIERAVARGSGTTAAYVRMVMDRQPSRGEWLAAARWVVDNSGDDDALALQCRRIWDKITSV